MNGEYKFLRNSYSIDDKHIRLRENFLEELHNLLDGAKLQFYKTFTNRDKEDYIKSFFDDTNIISFLNSPFIDSNMFYNDLILEMNNYFNTYLGIDIITKEDSISELQYSQKFAKLYYPIYLSVVLNQPLILKVVFLIFSNITPDNIKEINKALQRNIQPVLDKKIRSKYNIDKSNYVLSIDKIMKNKEEFIKVIEETNLFTSNLTKNFNKYYSNNDDIIFDTLFTNSSKIDISSLFKNLFKEDNNYETMLLNLSVSVLNKELNFIKKEGY